MSQLNKLLDQSNVYKYNYRWKADEEHREIAFVTISHVLEIFNFKCFHFQTLATQIGPGVVFLEISSIFGSVQLIQTVTPIEPLVQKVSHHIYCSRFHSWYAKIIIWSLIVNFARDALIFNNKMFKNNPKLVREEHQVKLFRKWFSQFYSKNSKTLAEAFNNDLEW